jgi:hypothetical protein
LFDAMSSAPINFISESTALIHAKQGAGRAPL